MRIVLVALFCVLFASSAHADGQAFPPVGHCGSDQPFMSFTGTGNTYCSTGQDVLVQALKDVCQPGQMVVYNGNNVICKDEPSAPTCPSGQVLTFLTNTGFTCVNPQASVPNCTANQFLTYSNNAFQCANVQNSGSAGLTYCSYQSACVDPTMTHFGLCGTGMYASFETLHWTGSYWRGTSVGAEHCVGGVLILDSLLNK